MWQVRKSSQVGQNGMRARKGDWLRFFIMVKGTVRVRGLCGLNVLQSSNKGATRLSYQFALLWGWRERGSGEAVKMLKSNIMKWTQTLHFSKLEVTFELGSISEEKRKKGVLIRTVLTPGFSIMEVMMSLE